MARMIRHEATGPIEVPPQDKSVWICACGLSQNLPYCDGAHKVCRQAEKEASGQVHVYSRDRTRVVRIEEDEEA
ncbi:MAG: CDGSH iron-sulfur domain-containing protein [Phycisphaeraceae bacterium]